MKIIHAEKSDLFDVLADVAYALSPATREERAAKAKLLISTQFNLNAASLSRLSAVALRLRVEELDQDKLTP